MIKVLINDTHKYEICSMVFIFYDKKGKNGKNNKKIKKVYHGLYGRIHRFNWVDHYILWYTMAI